MEPTIYDSEHGDTYFRRRNLAGEYIFIKSSAISAPAQTNLDYDVGLQASVSWSPKDQKNGMLIQGLVTNGIRARRTGQVYSRWMLEW